MSRPEATCNGETAKEAIQRSTSVSDRIRVHIGEKGEVWNTPLEELLGLFTEHWEYWWCEENRRQAIRIHNKYE